MISAPARPDDPFTEALPKTAREIMRRCCATSRSGDGGGHHHAGGLLGAGPAARGRRIVGASHGLCPGLRLQPGAGLRLPRHRLHGQGGHRHGQPLGGPRRPRSLHLGYADPDRRGSQHGLPGRRGRAPALRPRGRDGPDHREGPASGRRNGRQRRLRGSGRGGREHAAAARLPRSISWRVRWRRGGGLGRAACGQRGALAARWRDPGRGRRWERRR